MGSGTSSSRMSLKPWKRQAFIARLPGTGGLLAEPEAPREGDSVGRAPDSFGVRHRAVAVPLWLCAAPDPRETTAAQRGSRTPVENVRNQSGTATERCRSGFSRPLTPEKPRGTAWKQDTG